MKARERRGRGKEKKRKREAEEEKLPRKGFFVCFDKCGERRKGSGPLILYSAYFVGFAFEGGLHSKGREEREKRGPSGTRGYRGATL